MRLLIVEDDRDAADYIARAFREVGHVADLAPDGEEGLAFALDRQYDVLIVDRMLPKRDGLSVINTLMGMAIDVRSRRPVIGNVQGGLSGPAIKPIALLKVKQVYEVARPHDIPIIGQGGITTATDALNWRRRS